MPAQNVFMTPEEALFVVRLGVPFSSPNLKLVEAAEKCTKQFGREVTVDELYLMIVEAPQEAARAVNLAKLEQAKREEAEAKKAKAEKGQKRAKNNGNGKIALAIA